MDKPIDLAFMHNMLNAFDEAIYAIDRNRIVVYCNDQTEKLMKVRREDFVGKDYVTFLESVDATKESLALRTLDDGRERQVSNYFLWNFCDDDGFLADVRATPLRNESDEVEAVIIRVKDLTPKKVT